MTLNWANWWAGQRTGGGQTILCVALSDVCEFCVCVCVCCVGARPDVSIDNSLLRPGRGPALLNWALNKQGRGRHEQRWGPVGANGRKMREKSQIKNKKNAFVELVNAVEREVGVLNGGKSDKREGSGIREVVTLQGGEA